MYTAITTLRMPTVFRCYLRIFLAIAIAIASILSLSSGVSWSQTRENNLLRGLVTYQSSNSTPVEGVEISSFGANTTYTSSIGMFELTFSTKSAGDKVTLIIHKTGVVLLNSRDADTAFIRSNPDELVRLVMVRPEERNALLIQFYNIIVENTNAEFRNAFKEISTKLESLERNQLEERQELIARIRMLEQERDKQLARAETQAEQLSNVDLDQASVLAKAAFVEFEAGNVKEAIAILKDELLDETLRSAREEKRRAGERLQSAERAISESVENYMIKARFCAIDQEFQQADRNFSKAVEADLANFTNVDEYLKFLWDQQSYNRALEIGQQALPWMSLQEDRATISYWLGIIGIRSSDLQIVESSLEQALRDFIELNEQNPGDYRELISNTYNALGVYYGRFDRFGDALRAYEESLKQKDVMQDESGTALTLYNLGSLYNRTNQLPEAAASFERSIKIYRKLIAEEPESVSYREDMARAMTLVASFYTRTSEFEKARSYANEALALIRAIAEERGDSYGVMIALALNSKGEVELAAGDLDAAKEAFEEQLNIYHELGDKGGNTFQGEMANLLHGLGNYYIEAGDSENALLNFRQEFEILRRLAQESADIYQHKIAANHESQGEAYRLQQKRNEMLANYSMSLEIYRRLAANESVYKAAVASLLLYIADDYYYANGEIDQALSHRREARDIFETLWAKDPELYASMLCWTKLGNVKLHGALLVSEPDQTHLDNGLRLVHEIRKLSGSVSLDGSLPDCIKEADALQTRLENDPLEYLKGNVARDAAAALGMDESKKVDAKARYRDAIDYFEDAIRKTDKSAYKATLANTFSELHKLEENPATKAEILDEVVSLRREVHREENEDRWAGIQLARALTRRGAIKLDDTEEAGRYFVEAIGVYEGLDVDGEPDEGTVIELAEVYSLLAQIEPNYGERIENQNRFVDLLVSILPMSESDPDRHQAIASALADGYGSLSFYNLFVGRFDEAELAALKALELDPTQHWIKTNLGHSYLLRGQYGLAVSTYQELKGKSQEDRPYKEVLIEDFELLSANGITHADVRKARDMIETW